MSTTKLKDKYHRKIHRKKDDEDDCFKWLRYRTFPLLGKKEEKTSYKIFDMENCLHNLNF